MCLLCDLLLSLYGEIDGAGNIESAQWPRWQRGQPSIVAYHTEGHPRQQHVDSVARYRGLGKATRLECIDANSRALLSCAKQRPTSIWPLRSPNADIPPAGRCAGEWKQFVAPTLRRRLPTDVFYLWTQMRNIFSFSRTQNTPVNPKKKGKKLGSRDEQSRKRRAHNAVAVQVIQCLTSCMTAYAQMTHGTGLLANGGPPWGSPKLSLQLTREPARRPRTRMACSLVACKPLRLMLWSAFAPLS